jgi:hypothetical protein
MRTSMLPLVDIVRSSWLLADKSIDTTLTAITDVFDFYGRDLSADSGHALKFPPWLYAEVILIETNVYLCSRL